MPYCSPHGFVPLWIRHRKLSFWNYPNEGQVIHTKLSGEKSGAGVVRYFTKLTFVLRVV